jgi:uncharacterized 2Fe-2S/4Fe-4S cluster protein (DUF4445 family)
VSRPARARVRFLPDQRVWRGAPGTPLRAAAAAAGVALDWPCGGAGECGGCRVRLRGDAGRSAGAGAWPPADAKHAAVLGEAAAAEGWRLGCRLGVEGALVVEVPGTARLPWAKGFGEAAEVGAGAGGGAGAGAGARRWGLAVDAGTTTLAVALVELGSGAVAAAVAGANPQAVWGADVLSRVRAVAEEGAGPELQRLLVAAVERLALACAADAGVDPAAVAEVVVVGNAVMLHSFLGIDPTGLGQAPFRGEWRAAWAGRAGSAGLGCCGKAALYVAPQVGGHVGGDAVAAALAAGLDRPGGCRALIDLGTNTEVLLAAGDRLLCASAAAGPAFEGGGMRSGMRAGPGAIAAVRSAGDALAVQVLGGGPAVGVCGSGYLDALAALLAAGVVERSGRLRRAEQVVATHPALAARIGAAPGLAGSGAGTEPAFLLAGDAAAGIWLTAADIRQLQLAVGSIRAALQTLLARAGLEAGALSEVILAGGFGGVVRAGSAVATGLLPPLPAGRVRGMPHAAGAGARLLLVDGAARRRAAALAERAEHVELARDEGYGARFVAALELAPWVGTGGGTA